MMEQKFILIPAFIVKQQNIEELIEERENLQEEIENMANVAVLSNDGDMSQKFMAQDMQLDLNDLEFQIAFAEDESVFFDKYHAKEIVLNTAHIVDVIPDNKLSNGKWTLICLNTFERILTPMSVQEIYSKLYNVRMN